jgi:hypothetical protein
MSRSEAEEVVTLRYINRLQSENFGFKVDRTILVPN